jgi:three-Cys-motif partner protein
MKHRFGGLWTEQKLKALGDYLQFFPVALGKKFDLVYIDTFAGSGKCTIKVGPNGERTIEGSAAIALQHRFDRFFFIEQRRKHVRALEELKRDHRYGSRITIIHGDARKDLSGVLAAINWRTTRGVLFLDPYGLQCTWDMVKEVAATEALDVFFLVSVSGLTRQAARSVADIDADKEAALDRFLGTAAWRDALYKPPAQSDFFDSEQSHERDTGAEGMIQFVKERMLGVFPHVEEPLLLRGHNNAVLFALFFAVSNRAPKARALAAKVSRDVLSRLRS